MKRLMLLGLLPFLFPAVAGAFTVDKEVCMPLAADSAILTPHKAGECKAGYEGPYYIMGTIENGFLQLLKEHLQYKSEGVAGKPQVSVVEANFVVEANGKAQEGSIIIGKEAVLGAFAKNDLIVGNKNEVNAESVFVSGRENHGLASSSAIVGGERNETKETATAILGGLSNKAGGAQAVICGGEARETTELLQNLC